MPTQADDYILSHTCRSDDVGLEFSPGVISMTGEAKGGPIMTPELDSDPEKVWYGSKPPDTLP